MERNLQNRAMAHLKELGDYYVKIVGHPMQRNGVADLIVCHQGLFVALELKEKGNGESKLQQYERRKVEAAGGTAGVIYSLDEIAPILSLAEMNRR